MSLTSGQKYLPLLLLSRVLYIRQISQGRKGGRKVTLNMTLSKVYFVTPGQAVGKRPQLTGTGDHRAPCLRPAAPGTPSGSQAAAAAGPGRAEPSRIPRIPGVKSARGRCPFLHRPGPGAIGPGQPAQRRRRPPGPGPGAERREEEEEAEAGIGKNRRGEPPAQHGAGGVIGSQWGREAGAGPAPAFPARRSRAAPERLPARPRPGKEAVAGVNPWRGGAGGAEQSRAGSARGGRRERRPCSGGGGRGLGARPPSPPSPLPSARCAERGAREAPVTAARASAASSAVRGGGGGGRRGPARLGGPGAGKAAEMMPVSENGESSRRRSPAWRRAAGCWDASPFPAVLPAADGVRGAAVIPGGAPASRGRGLRGCGDAGGLRAGGGAAGHRRPWLWGARPAPAPPPAGAAPAVTGRGPRPPGLQPAAEARREAWGVRCVWVSGCAGGVSVCLGVFHPNPDRLPLGCGEGLNRPGAGGSGPPAGVKRAQAAAPCQPGSFLGSCHRFCEAVAYLSKTNPFISPQTTLIVFCDRIPVRFLRPASLPCRCELMQWSEESCS